MHNITDSTCEFGLSPDSQGACVITLATYCYSEYKTMQFVYGGAGLIAFLVSVFLYISSVRYDGTTLQMRSFLLCAYASLTFIVRAIDIKSYGHVLPIAVTSFLSWSCTDAIITILVMSLLYWICLIQETQMTFKLRLFQYVTIASVWGFDATATMTEFQSKGFGGVSGSTQLFVSASLIATISTTFLLYGLEILRRMNAAEEMVLPQHNLTEDGIPYQDSTAMMSASDRSTPVRRPSCRVYKVLILAESLSIVTISGQIYVAWTVQTQPWRELDCANGLRCEDIHVNVQVLHCFQVQCIAFLIGHVFVAKVGSLMKIWG